MSGILVRFVILVGARPWRDLIAMQRNRWPSNSTCFFGRPLTCLALLTGLSVNLVSSTFLFFKISNIWVFLIPHFFYCLFSIESRRFSSFNYGQFVIIALSLFLALVKKLVQLLQYIDILSLLISFLKWFV